MQKQTKVVKGGTTADYDIRVKAMTLATQHSRNCHSTTLVKLADTIYLFLIGKPQPKKEE